jgi:8-oxo-dGTP pyrophosphatase MutT (NUDIX family)
LRVREAVNEKSQVRTVRDETSAGGVVYRWSDQGPRFLLIRDAYAHWGLPKGHLEEGESPEAAALREVEEETGLGGLVLGPPLEVIDWHFRSRRGLIHKKCHFFLIESTSGDAVPQINEGITECLWLTPEEAVERISYDNTREVLRMAEGKLPTAG